MEREQRRAEAGFGRPHDADLHAQDTPADGGPGLVARAVADGDDSLQGWCSEVPQRLIGQCFDCRNPFQQALEEPGAISGPEAFAGSREGVAVKPGRLLPPQPIREPPTPCILLLALGGFLRRGP